MRNGRSVDLTVRAIAELILLPLALLAFASAQQETVLHSFGEAPDGVEPQSSLLADSAGNFYGTTYFGGTHRGGTVFKLTRTAGEEWAETVLYNFQASPSDGVGPAGGLALDAFGNLYGTTWSGGLPDLGTVFELTPATGGTWKEQIIYTFRGDQGNEPMGNLVFDSSGNLFGTTIYGGAHGSGTVFELSLGTNGRWSEQTLYSFSPFNRTGVFPQSGVILDGAGNLYGTTLQGGSGIDGGDGAVFELSPTITGWSEKVLFAFGDNYQGSGPNPAGSNPSGGLVFDLSGNLYGGAALGGRGSCDPAGFGCGVVFELTPASDGTWSEKVLFDFDGNNGAYPAGNLTFVSSGNLFGATANSRGGGGEVFRLSHQSDGNWTETILQNFSDIGGSPYGPNGGLVFDASGNLYGTSAGGGAYGGSYPYGGTVFEIIP